MSQNCFFKQEDDQNLIIGNNQPIKTSNSCILMKNEMDKNVIKKVVSLDSNVIESKRKSKYDNNNHKLSKVKNTMYTKMQNNFILASKNLLKSYEEVEKLQKNLITEQNKFEFSELHKIVSI